MELGQKNQIVGHVQILKQEIQSCSNRINEVKSLLIETNPKSD